MNIKRLSFDQRTPGVVQADSIRADISLEVRKKRSKLFGALDGYTDRTDLSTLLTSEGKNNA